MTPLQVDRRTGRVTGSLECGHPLSSLSTRTENGDQFQVCEGCEKRARPMALDRELCLYVLQESPRLLRANADEMLPCSRAHNLRNLAEAIETLLPELERAPVAEAEPASPWAYASMDYGFTKALDVLCDSESAGRALTAPKADWLALREILKATRAPAPQPEPPEFPTIEECRTAVIERNEVRDCPDYELSAWDSRAIEITREKCLAARAPRVEWPEWILHSARAGAGWPSGRFSTSATPAEWSELLALMEKGGTP